MKSYLVQHLVNERKIEPAVIKKANQFVILKFGDVQLLDLLYFLGGAWSLDSFSKAYKISETKKYFPHESFDDPEKLNNTQLSTYETFFRKLRNIYPLENDYSDLQSSIDVGLTTEEALS